MTPQGLILRLAGIVLLAFALALGANYCIDAYGVFGVNVLPRQGEFQERFHKIEYLKQVSDFDTYIFGSSRAAVIRPADLDKAIGGARTFNLAASKVNQWDNEQLVNWLVGHKPQTKRIFVQLDWPEGYGGDRQYALLTAMHPDLSGRSRIEFLWDYLSQFNFDAIYEKLSRNFGGTFTDYDLKNGNWSRPRQDEKIERNCKQYVDNEGDFVSYKLSNDSKIIDDNLQAIARYTQVLKQHDIQVVFFLAPSNWRSLDQIDFDKYEKFLKALVEFGAVYNFMYYSDLTLNDCNYYDALHYRPDIGAIVVGIVGKQSPAPQRNIFVLMGKLGLAEQLAFLRRNFSERGKK